MMSIFKDTAFSFFSPAKKRIIVFDCVGSDIIIPAVLEGIDYIILHTRLEKVYFSAPILLRLGKNILRLEWRNVIAAKRGMIKQLVRQVYRIYLLSCVEYIDPDVVITFIDNSIDFQWISRVYKKAEFFAVQNGVRDRISARKWLSPPPLAGSTFSLPHFFCFGECERDLYRELHHEVDYFYPVGALRGVYYKTQFAKKENNIIYDLCLVSELDYSTVQGGLLKKLEKGFALLNDYLLRFMSETGFSLCIASRSRDTWERDYYKASYGEKAQLIPFDRGKMSTYFAMDESAVVVAIYSTVAREAFGWGKKVLFCNFTGDEDYSLSQDGLWSLSEPDYETFKDRLNCIYNMDTKKYIETTREYAKYLMNYDFKNPAHQVIRNMILKELQ